MVQALTQNTLHIHSQRKSKDREKEQKMRVLHIRICSVHLLLYGVYAPCTCRRQGNASMSHNLRIYFSICFVHTRCTECR